MSDAAELVLTEEQKAELAAIDRQQAFYRKNYPNLSFVPNPPQYRFIQELKKGCAENKRIFLALWANGTGKSFLWPNIAWAVSGPPNHLLPWFDFSPLNNWPYPKRGRIICNSKQLRENTGRIWRAIHECWPPAHYAERKQGYEYPASWTMPETGWVWDAMTENQDLSDHESEEIGMLIVDEPCSQAVWGRYYSRMRKGGLMMMFATLMEQSEWVESDLMTSDDVVWFHARDHDNCAQCARLPLSDEECDRYHKRKGTELRGYLDHDTINAGSRHYLDNEVVTRTTGVPIHWYGREFAVSDEHAISREKAEARWRNGELTTYLALDPHQLRPWFIEVGGIDSDGSWHMLDEWPRENYIKMKSCSKGIAEYARIIKELEQKWGISQKIIDRKFADQQIRFQAYARTLWEELMITYGLFFVAGVVDPLKHGNGVTKLKEALKFDRTIPLGPENHPRFYVCDDLFNTWNSIKNVTKKRFTDPETGRLCEKLDDKYLDAVRCCMYLVTHRASHNPDKAPASKGDSLRSSIEADCARLGVEVPESLAVNMI